MPSKARAGGASSEGRKVGGATFKQATLPFGRAEKSPSKAKQNKTPEHSPEDSPATVKRQRKIESQFFDEAEDDNKRVNGSRKPDEQRGDVQDVGLKTERGNGDEYFEEDIGDGEKRQHDQKACSEKPSGKASDGGSKRGAAKDGKSEPSRKRPKSAKAENGAPAIAKDEPPAKADDAAAAIDLPNGADERTEPAKKAKGGKGNNGAGKKRDAKGRSSKGTTGNSSRQRKAMPQATEADIAVLEPEQEGPFLTPEEAVVGSRCKAYDPRDKKLYTAKILEVNSETQEAFIHYLGWQSKWDQWYAIGKLKPVEAAIKEVEVPVPQLVLKSVTATAGVFEAVLPEGAEVCPTYQVSLDGEECASCSFTSEGGNTFTQKLPSASTLQVRLRLKSKSKQFAAGKWGQWSESIEVTTPEEEKWEEGERAAKQKAIGEGFSLSLVSAPVLTDEQKAEREQRRAVQFHDSFCAVCFGWGEEDRRLICCDGDCRQSFCTQCVNLDDADVANDEEWRCHACTAGRLKCLLCNCPSPAEEMVICSVHSCKKPFHEKCLIKEGITIPTGKAFRCPQHECRSCGQEANVKGFCAKFIKCIRCPDGYHDKCMPSIGHELFPDQVPLRMICKKHEADIKTLRKLKVQSSLEGAQLHTGPVVMPEHPVFKALVHKLAEHIPERFRLPVQYAGARNYEGSKPAPFKLLQRNFYAMGRPKICKEDIVICACSPDAAHVCSTLPESMLGKIPQGCGDNCENRLTCVECLATTCPLGEKCGNQRLQKRAYARLDLFKTNGRGWGLKALEKIPAGALVQEYIGEVLSTQDFRARSARYNENTPVYFFNLDNDWVIDASAMGSMARFINHSCGPNCHTEKWTIGNETRIGIYATEDIEAGQEVTYNYQFESFGGMRHKCLCGAPNCSGELGKRPKSAKELEAEQAALKKKKGKKKKAVADVPTPHLEAVQEPEIADPAEKMQGRLVRIARGNCTLSSAASAVQRSAASEEECGPGKKDVEMTVAGADAGSAPATQANGASSSAAGNRSESAQHDAVKESDSVQGVDEGMGEVLALHAEMALVRKEGEEELRRTWRFTREVLQRRDEEREEKAKERLQAQEAEQVAAKSKDSKDPLPGLLAPVVNAVEVQWIPLTDVILLSEDDAHLDVPAALAAAEAPAVKKAGEEAANASPSKGKPKEKVMRITKVTDERVAELSSRLVTDVKVQPPDGRLSTPDLARVCQALKAHTSVTRLDLDSALIGDEGCTEIAGLIKASRTLQAVDLQYNGITDVGVKQLAKAFTTAAVKPSVVDLHLGRNDISKASVDDLESALQRSPTMILSLSGNKLSGPEMETIQQWHVGVGDIRELLVEGDRARCKRRDQRIAAREAAAAAAAEEEENEEEGEGEGDAETQETEGTAAPKDSEGIDGSGATVGATVKREADEPCDAASKQQENGACSETTIAELADKEEALVESSGTESGKVSVGTEDGSEAAAQ